jgi:hypothetical protein
MLFVIRCVDQGRQGSCRMLGRRAILYDTSEEYLLITEKRLGVGEAYQNLIMEILLQKFICLSFLLF